MDDKIFLMLSAKNVNSTFSNAAISSFQVALRLKSHFSNTALHLWFVSGILAFIWLNSVAAVSSSNNSNPKSSHLLAGM